MNAPFFLEAQYIKEVSKSYSFFPWRSPPLNILPHECGQIPEISVILKNGAILRKRWNARGKVTKMSEINSMMLT